MSESFKNKKDSSGFNEFVDLVLAIKDRELLEDFLLGITTEAERVAIAHRLQIIKKLLDDKTQYEIAEEMGVGVATVTRGAKELAQGRFKVLRRQK
ncbi:trp operon repressor [Candidatus Parcubacteria bacterium]|nr:trp operon repressor [Candidatus Parcubacteria bacterium]